MVSYAITGARSAQFLRPTVAQNRPQGITMSSETPQKCVIIVGREGDTFCKVRLGHFFTSSSGPEPCCDINMSSEPPPKCVIILGREGDSFWGVRLGHFLHPTAAQDRPQRIKMSSEPPPKMCHHRGPQRRHIFRPWLGQFLCPMIAKNYPQDTNISSDVSSRSKDEAPLHGVICHYTQEVERPLMV